MAKGKERGALTESRPVLCKPLAAVGAACSAAVLGPPRSCVQSSQARGVPACMLAECLSQVPSPPPPSLPAPQSFELVLEAVGCKASEACFLDDSTRNIQSAHELGINTVLVRSN